MAGHSLFKKTNEYIMNSYDGSDPSQNALSKPMNSVGIQIRHNSVDENLKFDYEGYNQTY